MKKYSKHHTPNALLFLGRNYPRPGRCKLYHYPDTNLQWLVVSGGGGNGYTDMEMRRELLEDMMSTGYYPQAQTVTGTLDIVRLLV